VSSKQHQLQHDAPDRFYDISASCKFTIDSAVKSSTFKCAAMQSRVSRLSSVHADGTRIKQEASMVHNMPNLPILASATREAIGPGTYIALPQSQASPRPGSQEGVNFIMMPQHVRPQPPLVPRCCSLTNWICRRMTGLGCQRPTRPLWRHASVGSLPSPTCQRHCHRPGIPDRLEIPTLDQSGRTCTFNLIQSRVFILSIRCFDGYSPLR
jgi:hypothetical protein